jgi:hypothetical protein
MRRGEAAEFPYRAKRTGTNTTENSQKIPHIAIRDALAVFAEAA